MNNQEAFTRIIHHLRHQGRKSVDEDEGCMYRDRVGRRCAIGVLITDKFYSPQLEGHGVHAIAKLIRYILPGVDMDLLVSMQGVHDSWSVADWEAQFVSVAHDFHLCVPPIEPQDATTGENNVL